MRRKTEASQLRHFLQLGASVSTVARISERLCDNPDLNVNRNTLMRASNSVAAPLRRVHTLDMVRHDEEFDCEFFDPSRLVAHLVEASPKSSSFRCRCIETPVHFRSAMAFVRCVGRVRARQRAIERECAENDGIVVLISGAGTR